MKHKFHVGDVVKPNKKADENYTITTTSVVREAIVTELRDYTMDIKIIKGSCSVGEVFTVEEKYFDLVRKAKQETIVIYRNDNKVVALDKTTGEKAEAKCNPADEFDFRTGAKLAFNRLMGEDVKPDDGVREVKRKAKVGEYIKIVDAHSIFGTYKNGDILKVTDVTSAGCECEGSDALSPGFLWHREYVVLENYKPEEDDSEIHVGDMVEVTHRGHCYSTYDTWSGLGSYRQNYVKGVSVEDGTVAKVLNIANHDDVHGECKPLALIQNPKTTQVFIIKIKGIKKVER